MCIAFFFAFARDTIKSLSVILKYDTIYFRLSLGGIFIGIVLNIQPLYAWVRGIILHAKLSSNDAMAILVQF